MKDYKKTESLDTGLVGGSGIIWMFSGIVLGLMVGIGMYYLSNQKTPMISSTDSVQNKIVKAQKTTPVKVDITNKQLQVDTKLSETSTSKSKGDSVPFSYYAVLPNLDVPVNTARPIETRVEIIAEKNQEVETVVAKQVDVEEKQLVARKSGDYLLQVASFKRKGMAKLTRGRLAKKGVKAYIKEKKVKGRMWYRVVAGPVGQGNIDNWKNTAEKLGHRPMVISVR